MMQTITNKSELIDSIQTARQGLDRCLFNYEKDASAEFIPGEYFKFSEEETHAPGVNGSWSLYQVLSQVSSSEQAFMISRLAGIYGPGGFSMISMVDMSGVYGGLVGSPKVQPLPEFIQGYCASYQKILAYVRGLPEETLFNPEPMPVVAELFEATCQRYDWAREQISGCQGSQSRGK